MIKLFLARESLVSDISAGDGKIASLFYSVDILNIYSCWPVYKDLNDRGPNVYSWFK